MALWDSIWMMKRQRQLSSWKACLVPQRMMQTTWRQRWRLAEGGLWDKGRAVNLLVDIHQIIAQAFSEANRCSATTPFHPLINLSLQIRRSTSCRWEGMTTSCLHIWHNLLKFVKMWPPFITERGNQLGGLCHIISKEMVWDAELYLCLKYWYNYSMLPLWHDHQYLLQQCYPSGSWMWCLCR